MHVPREERPAPARYSFSLQNGCCTQLAERWSSSSMYWPAPHMSQKPCRVASALANLSPLAHRGCWKQDSGLLPDSDCDWPPGHAVHVNCFVREPGAPTYSPFPHVSKGVQLSLFILPENSTSPSQSLQARSDVGVGSAVTYSPNVHNVIWPHCRPVVGVGGSASY